MPGNNYDGPDEPAVKVLNEFIAQGPSRAVQYVDVIKKGTKINRRQLIGNKRLVMKLQALQKNCAFKKNTWRS